MNFDALWTDIRYALRQIKHSPRFSFILILVLAVGFGVSTAIFSAVRTVLLAPLPYQEPTRLVQIVSWWPKTGAENGWSAPLRDAVDWKDSVPAFQDIAMYHYNLMNLTEKGVVESVYGLRVSANLMPMLGVRPELGAWFPAEYDRPGSNHVVLLSDDLWRRRFHADQKIVGKSIQLDGQGFQVLGVMPRGFNFPLRLGTTAQLPTDQMQFWTPLGLDLAKVKHGDPDGGVIARLSPGVSMAEAQMQLQAECRQLQSEFPASNKDLSAKLSTLREQTVSQVNGPLLTLFAATGLIMLLACTNIAGLLLTKGELHANELAVRMALGGSSWRVARVPLMEGLLLWIFGGLLGIPCAVVSLNLLLRLAPIDVPRLAGTHIDLAALGFSIALVLMLGTFLGALNAMQVLKRSPREVLSEGSRYSAGSSRGGVRGLLVIGQVALAVILMSGAGLMLRTFVNLLSTDIGYNPNHVVYAVTVLPASRYPTFADTELFYRKVLDRLRTTPGIELAAASTGFPMVGQYDTAKVNARDSENIDTSSGISADLNEVSPGYLEAVGVGLIRGRLIGEGDTASTPQIAVIDSSLANGLWPGQNPIGKQIDAGDPAKPVWREVVGVVAPMHNRALDAAERPGVFLPLSQGNGYVNFLVLKSPAPPDETARLLRKVVSGVDSDQGVFFAQSMPQLIGDSIATRRFLFIALAFFGVTSLILSVLGVYGLVSFIAARRVREVGIRMALGATRGSVAWLVLSQGAQLALWGTMGGLCTSFLLNRLLSGLLFGVRAFDAQTAVFTIVILEAGILFAALIPAWRAAKLQPMQALRME
jgi:putative ABC transport system permease protein